MSYRIESILAIKRYNNVYQQVFYNESKVISYGNVKYLENTIPSNIDYDKKLICYTPQDLSQKTEPKKNKKT